MPTLLQLGGTVEFGLTSSSLVDMSCEVYSFRLVSTLEVAAVPITPDNPQQEFRKRALSWTAEVGFRNVTSRVLQHLIMSAQQDDSTTGGRKPGELYFRAVQYPGAHHATNNPRYGGWVIPQNVSWGGPVGRVDEQTQRWVARAVAAV